MSSTHDKRLADLEKRLAALERAKGQQGTGACICKASPESTRKSAERSGCTLVEYGINLCIDHRCPHHGEKAQPAVWGRFKDKELFVTPRQWESLGVTYPTTTQIAADEATTEVQP